MKEFNLELEIDQLEMADFLKNADPEGCGGYLPVANQLDSRCQNYLKELGGQLVREYSIPFDRTHDESDWSVSFWKIGDTRMRLRYFQIIEQDDWPCVYPERERLELKVWGDIKPELEAKLREYFSEKVAA